MMSVLHDPVTRKNVFLPIMHNLRTVAVIVQFVFWIQLSENGVQLVLSMDDKPS